MDQVSENGLLSARAFGAIFMALWWAVGVGWTTVAQARGDGFVHSYLAHYTDTTVGEIVRLGIDFEPSWLGTVGGGKVFSDLSPRAHLEWELHVVRHWGMQHHGEVNGILSVRWYGFPWEERLHTSVAIGTGPSYAFRPPPMEERRRREATRYLQFLLLEVAAAPPSWQQWSGFVRVHHRSGVFGLVAEAGGSNFIGFGLRRHLQ